MSWLLDTNFVIDAVKGQPSVRGRPEQLQAVDVPLSPIVLRELDMNCRAGVGARRDSGYRYVVCVWPIG